MRHEFLLKLVNNIIIHVLHIMLSSAINVLLFLIIAYCIMCIVILYIIDCLLNVLNNDKHFL